MESSPYKPYEFLVLHLPAHVACNLNKRYDFPAFVPSFLKVLWRRTSKKIEQYISSYSLLPLFYRFHLWHFRNRTLTYNKKVCLFLKHLNKFFVLSFVFCIEFTMNIKKIYFCNYVQGVPNWLVSITSRLDKENVVNQDITIFLINF